MDIRKEGFPAGKIRLDGTGEAPEKGKKGRKNKMDERLAKRIAALRLERQRFNSPVDEAGYEALFRQMSPVRCVYWSAPGNPPELFPRTAFDDAALCFRLRARQEVVKGRFQGGGIGYIFAGEWPLFLSAYRKAPARLSLPEEELLRLLEREGPLNIGLMRELTGLRAKDITPILHKLQTKFLVFEDQADNEGDRSWQLFRQAFPHAEEGILPKIEAIAILLLRFCRLNVWIDERMAVSYYRFAAREVKAAFAALAGQGKLLPLEGGWIAPEDEALLRTEATPQSGVFALHRNDFLVKSLEHQLAGRYGRDGLEALWYLLIDGEFQGAVLGRFHNGPYELEDVELTLSSEEAQRRRPEILAAVERAGDPFLSPLRRYLGEAL